MCLLLCYAGIWTTELETEKEKETFVAIKFSVNYNWEKESIYDAT